MKFTIGNVFETCASLLRGGFWTIVLAGLAIYAIEAVVSGVTLLLYFNRGDLGFLNGPLSFVSIVVSYLGIIAYWCAATDIALLKATGKPVELGAVLKRAAISSVPVLGIAILWFLGWMIGAVFLIVPGIIFAVVFAVPVPAFIYEKTGVFGAFARARALTKGHRWGIFGINVLVNVGMYLIAGAGMLLFGGLGLSFSGEAGSIVATALAVIALIIFWIVLAAALPVLNTAIYITLRNDKGEPLLGGVEKVFE